MLIVFVLIVVSVAVAYFVYERLNENTKSVDTKSADTKSVDTSNVPKESPKKDPAAETRTRPNDVSIWNNEENNLYEEKPATAIARPDVEVDSPWWARMTLDAWICQARMTLDARVTPDAWITPKAGVTPKAEWSSTRTTKSTRMVQYI